MEGRAYKERYRLCYLLKFIRGEYSGNREWVEGRAYKERYCLCYLLKFIGGGSIRVLVTGGRAELIRKDIVYVTF